jgi:hypothetical protein
MFFFEVIRRNFITFELKYLDVFTEEYIFVKQSDQKEESRNSFVIHSNKGVVV